MQVNSHDPSHFIFKIWNLVAVPFHGAVPKVRSEEKPRSKIRSGSSSVLTDWNQWFLLTKGGTQPTLVFVMAPCLVTNMSKGHGMNFWITNNRSKVCYVTSNFGEDWTIVLASFRRLGNHHFWRKAVVL